MKRVTNNIFSKLSAIIMMLISVVACNEKLHIVEENQDGPIVEDFEPKSGVTGSEIHITGRNLAKVDSIKIGGVKVAVQRLNHNLVIANVNALNANGELTGGIIEVFTPYGVAKTADSYTVDYVEPILELDELKWGKLSPNDALTLSGYYLNSVTEMFFIKEGTRNRSVVSGEENSNLVKGRIIGQGEDFLRIQVPYFSGKAVGMKLAYRSGKNIVETEPVNFPDNVGGLELVLKTPTVSYVTEKKMQGFEIELEGTDFSVVDSVMIGGLKAEIQTAKSSDTKLVCLLSDGYRETTDADIKLMYYNEEGDAEVDKTIRVIKPNYYFWKDKTLNSGNMTNADIGILSGFDGRIYSTCEFAGSDEIKKKCHLGVAAVSGGLAFVSMVKNGYMKCGGVGLEGGLLMRFFKLSAATPEANAFLEKIKNKTLEDFEPIDQLKEFSKKSVTAARYIDGNDEYNTTNTQGMEIGGANMVIVYKANKANVDEIAQIGFIELTGANTETPTKGSLTVNFYFKDLTSE
ncbi:MULTISPECIES: IPT/TIG domain-containing protein [Bacteroides]|jgi:hypothetical protein|uniref:IPT/TIG domain-containing protein n=1 Tax=Bacteroides TaxID=816 RepID=UPI00164B935D|nr:MULTISPECIES: IPT/TIG domain-containing protein [Bacteroides]MBC5587007.1 IPT/TIG domain-containing protein [Bacteroides sp. NSJ-39]